MNYVGIDVGKLELHVHIASSEHSFQVPNDASGFKRIANKLKRLGTRVQVVVEATGTYALGVATHLAGLEDIEVMIANPRLTKNFAKAHGQRGKTDAIDARMLARYAEQSTFCAWHPPADSLQQLRALTRRREQVVDLARMEKQRLAEAKSTGQDFFVEGHERMIAFLATEVAALEAEAKAHTAMHQELAAQRDSLLSVPGIGDVTAHVIIAEVGCLPPDLTGKQLTAFAGLDPLPNQSGRRDGRRHISKRGNARIRSILYIAAWNAKRFSPEVKALHARLVEHGKAPKVADVAVARKLLLVSRALLRSGGQWDGSLFSTAHSA